MQNISRFQACSPIRNSLFIDEQRERDARFFPKEICVSEIAQPDGRQLSSCIMETGLVFAQLRDVLAAKNSSIVAKKDDHGRPAFPERAEAGFAPIGIRQYDIRQRFAQRTAHSIHQYTEAASRRALISGSAQRTSPTLPQ